MPYVSKIQLPGSEQPYIIKDEEARQMISGGVSFIIAWDGTSTPVAANIPYGVQVVYQGVTYTGTLAAEGEQGAQPGAFYLVKSKPVYTHVKGDSAPTFVANKYYSYNSGTDTYTTLSSQPSDWTTNYKNYYENADGSDAYDEYVPVGTAGSKTWEKIGDTQVDLSDVVTDVTFTKATDVVLGEATTFTNASSSVTFGTPTTESVLTPTAQYQLLDGSVQDLELSKTYLSASASGTAVGANGTASAVTGYASPSTDTFVKSVTAETNKNLVVTSVPNVTGNTSVTIPNVTGNTSVTIPNVTGNTDVTVPQLSTNAAVTANLSNWTFTMGSGSDAETLIIGGGNGSTVTATNTVFGTDATASKVTLGTALSASKVTLGTALTATNTTLGNAITVATGETSTTGTGDPVVTGVTVGTSGSAITALGTPSTATVLTGVTVTTQPTITLSSNSSSGTGRVQVATGLDDQYSPYVSSTIDLVNYEEATAVAITGMPTATAAAQTITVGTNDKVTALTNSTTVTVTKGQQ